MAPHVLSLMNTIKQYNGTKWVQPGPAQSSYCGILSLLGETNTLGSTHKLQLMPLYFPSCVFLLINTKQYNARKCIVVFFLLGETSTLSSTHELQECQLMPLYFQACVFLLINTISQYNARKWVQIGPAQGILVSWSCLEELTNRAALTTGKNENILLLDGVKDHVAPSSGRLNTKKD